MDSNRKTKLERMKTPVHLNASEYHFKNSATKRFSPNLSRRPNLNETINCRAGLPISDAKIKKLSTCSTINYETECDIAYNEYLQALLRRQVVTKTVTGHKDILEGQLLVQSENLYKRNKNLEEVVRDTKTFEKKREIVNLIDLFQKNLNDLRTAYTAYDMKNVVNHLKEVLNLQCDGVILKNIKPLETQEDYDKFINNVELCIFAMEKIINSGRDFEKVHDLAEQIRGFIEIRDTISKSQQVISNLEKEAMYSFLKNTSDFFAMRHKTQLQASE